MIKNSIIFAMLLLWSNNILLAQGTTPNCTPITAYIQQHDGAGKNPFSAAALKPLNDAAIKLAQAFPEPYCSAFKVYDYGFTPLSQYTKGGYAEDFELMKLQCMGADRKQPYLLFAREVNTSGIVSKIWVDVFLPNKDNFACLKEIQRELIKIRVEKEVADAMEKTGGDVIFSEVAGMDKLREEVQKVVDGCYCGRCKKEKCATYDDTYKLLFDKGFLGIDCKVTPKPAAKNNPNNRSVVKDFIIKIEDEEFALSTFFAAILQDHPEVTTYTTEDEDLCSGNFTTVENSFIANSVNGDHIWVHIFDDPDSDNDLFAVKTNSLENFGKYFIGGHYKITIAALEYFNEMTISQSQRDLLAHYASTFADYPSPEGMKANKSFYWSVFKNLEFKTDDIDYRNTIPSQTLSWDPKTDMNKQNYNIWHSMRSPEEAKAVTKADGFVTADEAKIRGMEWGWAKIFESCNTLKNKGLKFLDLKKNTAEMEQFAQGIHALQDAYAHKGSYLKEDIRKPHIHSAIHGIGDLAADTDDAIKISRIAIGVMVFLTENYAALNYDDITLLRDDYRTLKNGDNTFAKFFDPKIVTMSSPQFNQFRDSFKKYLSTLK